ncbi:hypothetical protein MGG_15764 [Pyricularia oryzae 70-15]|uniref:Uncharacterized protein n=3 Tax=Pyricularia oryzae TaxID=318829 RepID=G4MVQ6_PYRO7|nr:uncharacterized protein MGG_15764 [Pyricularia oryzae 70-15]EHA54972.1 hypothetical protein MGG_15764 [Pyricularia oryzae 70-15]ELQ37677.1 hypothetical protein OOU_Y34scaffold00584g10 [Pyricularia oryzae Y34]
MYEIAWLNAGRLLQFSNVGKVVKNQIAAFFLASVLESDKELVADTLTLSNSTSESITICQTD